MVGFPLSATGRKELWRYSVILIFSDGMELIWLFGHEIILPQFMKLHMQKQTPKKHDPYPKP